MKKQDKHPIDSFFKENIAQNFPYDPALWNKADKGIAALFNRKRILYFSLLFLLFISSVAVFFANFGSKQEKITRAGKSSTVVLNEKNSETKTSGYKNKSDEIAFPSFTEKGEVSSATVVSNSDDEIKKPRFKQKENTESQNGEKFKIKGEEEIKEKESTVVPSMQEPTVSEEATIAKIMADENILFTDFFMMTKPFQAFPLSNATIENPIKCPGVMNEKRKRGFGATIEFENLNSVFIRHHLSGLSKTELDYRSKYEKVQKFKGYSLNILMQRGGFGLVTGLGYREVAIKTNYVISNTTFELSESKYKMIRDSIPYKGGYWSSIRE